MSDNAMSRRAFVAGTSALALAFAGTALADILRALWGERVTTSVRGRPDEEGVLS